MMYCSSHFTGSPDPLHTAKKNKHNDEEEEDDCELFI